MFSFCVIRPYPTAILSAAGARDGKSGVPSKPAFGLLGWKSKDPYSLKPTNPIESLTKPLYPGPMVGRNFGA